MSDSIPPVAAPQFSISVRGYDRMQVETYVEQMQHRLDEARARLDRSHDTHTRAVDDLHRRIGELEDQLAQGERDRLVTTEPSFHALGEHVGRMLELAQTEANAIRERATHEAEEIVERARHEAERLTTEHQERKDELQRQLRALHGNISTLLGGPDIAAAPYPDEHPAAPDPLDDSTQVFPAIRTADA